VFTFFARVDVFVCFLVFIFSQNQNLGFSCGAFEFLEGYNQASVTKNWGDVGIVDLSATKARKDCKLPWSAGGKYMVYVVKLYVPLSIGIRGVRHPSRSPPKGLGTLKILGNPKFQFFSRPPRGMSPL